MSTLKLCQGLYNREPEFFIDAPVLGYANVLAQVLILARKVDSIA